MKFINDFIGNHSHGVTERFTGGDSEEQFKRNLASQPADWYYRNVDITYSYNEYGHRCKSVAEIDLDNYILFTGCSNTEGVGLELEKTFPYLTANDLGLDYYNLAVGGSGIDIMAHNLLMWIHTVKKLPKALVIMWPQTTRYARLKENKESLYLELPSCTTTSDSEEFMVIGDKINFFETVRCMSKKTISAAYTCKTIHLKPDHLYRDDRARDLSHAGITSHRLMADSLVRNLRV
jgi:hypothetical protein